MKTGGINNIVMSAYNNLTSTNNAIEKTARALSTGLRTATAADDASGFAMGLKMSSQIAGVDRAIRNSQDGVSLLQTAEGGLNEINSMLQRMRELTLEAATDTLTTQDRNYIQHEIGELRKAIDSTAASTTFNNKRLLDGSSAVEWSSDNSNISVKASGALTVTDKFGQKKRIEGNYKIEVKAKPGQGEVKKTNIFDVTTAKEVYR
ncbi:MAG: flagellin, partial [Synergistaceae bacterium]|nr:flagellin [Synergistaceae bacterium]